MSGDQRRIGPLADGVVKRRTASQQAARYRRLDMLEYLRWRSTLPWLGDITDERAAWRAFFDAHGDRCAICREPGGRLVEDHDHTTGLVRGLLCHSCNVMTGGPVHRPLAWFEPIDRLRVLYGQWPPAAVMGYRAMYPTGGVELYEPAEGLSLLRWEADGIAVDRDHPSQWTVR